MITYARTAKPILVLTLAAFVLAGCNARWNPFNRSSGEQQVDLETGEINPLVPGDRDSIFATPEVVYAGIPIDQITDLRIDRTRTGAIVVVEGLAARQGPFEVRLVPENVDELPVDGVLTYTFAIVYPVFATPVGSEATRRVTAARSISNKLLEQTRVIRLVAERNTRETRV